MKQFLSILFISISYNCQSQTYISFAPSLTTDIGTIADKSNIAFEIGRQWDVFSLGIDFGKTSLSRVNGRDTTAYLELRPNLNIFQQGKFTNTFTPGIGYVFNAKQNLLIEFTSGIEYSYTEKIHFNVFFGQYFYSGREFTSNVNFFGISAAFYFAPVQAGSLIKQKSAPTN